MLRRLLSCLLKENRSTSKPFKRVGHQASTAEKYYRQIGGGGHLMEAYDAIGPCEFVMNKLTDLNIVEMKI